MASTIMDDASAYPDTGRFGRGPVVVALTTTLALALLLAIVAPSGLAASEKDRDCHGRPSACNPPPAPPPPPPPTGSTYYLDSSLGSDANSGTSPSAPWRTLAKASSLTYGPGDAVLLARGTRFTGGLALNAAGTTSNPVIVDAYGSGALPLITGGTAQRNCVQVSGRSAAIRHIQADSCGWAGFLLAGNSLSVTDSGAAYNSVGIHATTSSSLLEIRRNTLVANNSAAINPDSRMQILLNGSGAEVSHNTLIGPSSAAIEIYGYSGLNGGHAIHHNLSVDNEDFSEIGKTRDVRFFYNVIRSTHTYAHSLNIHGPTNTTYGPVYGIGFYNNTVYLTGSASQGFVCSSGCDGSVLQLRNNIFHAVWKAGYTDLGADEDYNLYDCPGCLFSQMRQGPHSFRADPQFQDATNGDFRLRSTSPAINRGIALGLTSDFAGGQVHIGAVGHAAPTGARPRDPARSITASQLGPVQDRASLQVDVRRRHAPCAQCLETWAPSG